jgi:hypothetical protein
MIVTSSSHATDQLPDPQAHFTRHRRFPARRDTGDVRVNLDEAAPTAPLILPAREAGMIGAARRTSYAPIGEGFNPPAAVTISLYGCDPFSSGFESLRRD